MEYKGVKVLTTKQLANIFRTNPTYLYNAFTRHRNKFELGKDYFILSKPEIAEWSKTVNLLNLKHVTTLYLWPAHGALKIGQSFKGLIAWEGYCQCICYYYDKEEYQTVIKALYEKFASEVGK